MSEFYYAGLTSQTIDVMITDSTTGLGKTGLVYNTSGLQCYYRKGAKGAFTQLTLATLATIGTDWSSGGFIEADATNASGIYRLDLANVMIDTAQPITIYIKGTGILPVPQRVECRALPSDLKLILAQAAQADANNLLKVDVEDIKGSAYGGTAGKFVDLTQFANPTQSLALTGTTISTTQVVASVTAPVQTNNIGASSAALNQVASAFSQTTGSVTSGTYASTATWDGTLHITASSTGTLDEYYEFNVGSTGQLGTGFQFDGYLTAAINTLNIFAYNWGSAAWEQIGTLLGQAATTPQTQQEYLLTNSHTSTTGNGPSSVAGVVRIRFQGSGLTTASLGCDRLLVGYTTIITVPANFSALSIDGSGRTLLQPTQTGVTIPTVTTLTNLPAITTDWLTAAGVKADAVTKIQNGLSTYAGGDTSGTTTLLSRLTESRASYLDGLNITNLSSFAIDSSGRITLTPAEHTNVATDTQTGLTAQGYTASRGVYLDNLNIGGAVASHADIVAINTSSSKHLVLTTVQYYERPESGSTVYTIEARTFAAADGSAVNADTTPTLTASGQTSGSLAANLSSATNPATGVYRWTYTVANDATTEPIRLDVSAAISSSTFTLATYTQVLDEVSTTWTATNATQLAAVYNKLPTNNIADETLILAALPAIDGSNRVLLQPVQPASLDFTSTQKTSLNNSAPAVSIGDGAITLAKYDNDASSVVTGWHLESTGTIIANWRMAGLDHYGCRYFISFSTTWRMWLDTASVPGSLNPGRRIISNTLNSYTGQYWVGPSDGKFFGTFTPHTASGATGNIVVTQFAEQYDLVDAPNDTAIDAIAENLLVDGPTNKIKVNPDHSVNSLATVDESAIAAGVVAGVGRARIIVVSALSPDGTELNLVTGDSYTVANGRSLTFSISNMPGLIGSTPKLYIEGYGLLATAPTIILATQEIAFSDVLAATTRVLEIGDNVEYQIRFEDSLDVATALIGAATIKRGLT